MKNKLISFILLTASYFTVGLLRGQAIGFWQTSSGTASTILTGSSNALAIGVPYTPPPNPSIMEAWGHIRYCPPPSGTEPVGFIVTRIDCNSSSSGGGTSGGGPGEGSQGGLFDPNAPLPTLSLPKFFFSNLTPVINLTLTSGPVTGTFPFVQGMNVGKSPLLWTRIEEPSTISGTPINLRTRLLQLPNGRTGINVANPRAALDVIGEIDQVTPTAIFGIKTMNGLTATSPENPYGIFMRYSKHISIFNNLPTATYNGLVQSGDQAILFTDGKNTDGAHLDGGLVLGPWSSSAAGSGMRMDKDGNISVSGNIAVGGSLQTSGNVVMTGDIELRGKMTCNGLVAKPKWWPDFVFDPSYRLMSLDSVAHFIQLYKHLPEMPAQDSVLSKGQDIGLIQQLQQKKIEELTLHLIAKDKQLQKQEDRIDELNKKVELLLQKISSGETISR